MAKPPLILILECFVGFVFIDFVSWLPSLNTSELLLAACSVVVTLCIFCSLASFSIIINQGKLIHVVVIFKIYMNRTVADGRGAKPLLPFL